jgi:uncharacterized membrane protein YhaH (DUF805 family)
MNDDAPSRPPAAAGGPRARPLRSLLTFGGRLGRGQFLVYAVVWHAVFGIGASIAFAVFVAPTFAFSDGRVAGGAGMGFAALAAVVYGLGSASLGVRRLHDLGRSGLWLLLAFVPLVNLALAAVLLLAPGSDDANVHGERSPEPPIAFAPAATANLVASSEAAAEAAFAEGRAYAERLAARANGPDRR